MKTLVVAQFSSRAMSLIEVAIAVGIVSFCLVSLMALFPTMLKSVRESREKALAQRMYQTITEDVHDYPVGAGSNRTYSFDAEGFLLAVVPPKPGQTFRSGVLRYEGQATNNVTAPLPTNAANTNIVLSLIVITDMVRDPQRKSPLLQRAVWTTLPPG